MGTASRSEPRHVGADPPGAPGIAHLAIVADQIAAASLGPPAAAAAAFDRARDVAAAAFAACPGLAVVSFYAPEIRAWLLDESWGRAAAEACTRGLLGLAATARSLGAGLRVLGRTDRLPVTLRELATAPAPARARTVAWFLDYSGREEVARAAGRFARERPGELLGDADLAQWLDTAGMPDPDLIVYAGGALEPKDFLVWQGSYAEIWHTPAAWGEFSPADLSVALRDYASRQRRFGR